MDCIALRSHRMLATKLNPKHAYLKTSKQTVEGILIHKCVPFPEFVSFQIKNYVATCT